MYILLVRLQENSQPVTSTSEPDHWITIISYTEKNSPMILSNPHLLRQFRTISHRSDKILTDSVNVPMKRYLLHENSNNS